MKKVMISQPMTDKSYEEIAAVKRRFLRYAKDQNMEVVNTLFTDEWYSRESMKSRGVVNIPLCFLAKSLEAMATCDCVYFAKGWDTTRGCRLEHEAAVAYKLEIIYE